MNVRRRDFLVGGAIAAAASPLAAASANNPVLENPRAAIVLACSKNAPPRLRSLKNRSTGFDWCQRGLAIDPQITAAGRVFPTWNLNSWKSSHARVLQLDYAGHSNLIPKQRLQTFDDTVVFDIQTDFTNIGSAPVEQVTVYESLRIPLRANLGPLQVHCVRRAPYSLERIPVGDLLEIQGGGWNRPGHAGLLFLEAMDSREFLFLGIEWERGWRFRLSKLKDVLWLTVDCTDLSHDIAPGKTLTGARTFVGLCNGDTASALNYARGYLSTHVFPAALPNAPWVAYDIWGTEAVGVEQGILDEIGHAAELGVELFYIDASWYEGSSNKGTGDWGCGLGSYTEDRKKFPRGLAYIGDQVRANGMKFGLWVAPNIVDSRLVGKSIPRVWLAQDNGADRVLNIPDWEAPVNQVCLGCLDYIEHLKTSLTGLVSDYKLDWLKWDNSGIPGSPGICNRTDHGHQAGDGSYAALVGQYNIFEHLHRKFPDLVLEQCGYGSRLDYGLARTIRANWLSDASFPASHVRENAMVAGIVYPSFYNGGWVIKEPELEKTKDPARLDTIYRSRMIGAFGFGTLHGQLSERVSLFPREAIEAAKRNIPLYKKYRHLLRENYFLLFPPGGSPEEWQAVEFTDTKGSEAVVLCFRGASSQGTMRIPVRGLRESNRYTVTSANSGSTFEATGRALNREGVIVSLLTEEMSEVLLIG